MQGACVPHPWHMRVALLASRQRLLLLPPLSPSQPPTPPTSPAPLTARRRPPPCAQLRLGYELATATEAGLGHQLQLRVCLASAQLSIELGQQRKSSFYLLEAARRYRNNCQWHAAHEVLLVAAPHLQLAPLQWLQFHAPWRVPATSEPRASLAAAAAALAQNVPASPGAASYDDGTGAAPVVLRMVDAHRGGWSHLQQVVLAMLIEASEGMRDPPLYASYALFTLRLMTITVPEAVQARLVGLLEEAAPQLPPATPAPAIGLPWILSLKPFSLPPEEVPHRRHAKAASSDRKQAIFTFSPFEARRTKEAAAKAALEVIWVGGEKVCAVATVANPLCLPLHVDKISLRASVVAVPASSVAAATTTTINASMDGQPKSADEPNPRGSDGGGGGVAAKMAASASAVRFVAFGRPLTIPARCPGLRVELSGRVDGLPVEGEGKAEGGHGEGTVEWRLQIHGVQVDAYGMSTVHPIDANGDVALLPSSALASSSGRGPCRSSRGSSFVKAAGAKAVNAAGTASCSASVNGLLGGWVPPPPLDITLVPPLPLLSVEPIEAQLGTLCEAHAGQRTMVYLRVCNVGSLAVGSLEVELRLLSPPRLTNAGGFLWYEYSPLDLYDEGESDGAIARHHLDLQYDAIQSQLPMAPAEKLVIPLSLTLASRGHCSCSLQLKYHNAARPSAAVASSSAAIPDGEDDLHPAAAAAAASTTVANPTAPPWSRQLTLPVRLHVAAGLVLHPEAVVRADPQRLYLRRQAAGSASGGIEGEAPPPGCLLALLVTNEHATATFELQCSLGPEVDPPTDPLSTSSAAPSGSASSASAAQPSLVWSISPGASERLLLPLCCIDANGRHPMPHSSEMLEAYIAQRQPCVSHSEARTLRRAHLIKAVLLTAVRLRWRRLGQGCASEGALPLHPLYLSDVQVATLCRPPISLCAQLGNEGRAAAAVASPARALGPPPLQPLLVRITNSSTATYRRLVLRIRADPRGTEGATTYRPANGLSTSAVGVRPDGARHGSPAAGGFGLSSRGKAGACLSSSPIGRQCF